MEIKCLNCKQIVGNVEVGKIEKETQHICKDCSIILANKLKEYNDIMKMLGLIAIENKRLN